MFSSEMKVSGERASSKENSMRKAQVWRGLSVLEGRPPPRREMGKPGR